MENWSKTLLYSYRYLGTIVDTIDDMVKKLSVGSMYYNRKSTSNTLSQIEKMIELNDRKLNLTNLKVIIEECVAKLNSKDLEFVSLYYIDGLSFEEVADTLEVSIRTVFRRKRQALSRFSRLLKDKCTFEYLMTNYMEESWLMDFYKYNLKKSNSSPILFEVMDNESYDNGKEVFKALKELRRVAI